MIHIVVQIRANPINNKFSFSTLKKLVKFENSLQIPNSTKYVAMKGSSHCQIQSDRNPLFLIVYFASFYFWFTFIQTQNAYTHMNISWTNTIVRLTSLVDDKFAILPIELYIHVWTFPPFMINMKWFPFISLIFLIISEVL